MASTRGPSRSPHSPARQCAGFPVPRLAIPLPDVVVCVQSSSAAREERRAPRRSVARAFRRGAAAGLGRRPAGAELARPCAHRGLQHHRPVNALSTSRDMARAGARRCLSITLNVVCAFHAVLSCATCPCTQTPAHTGGRGALIGHSRLRATRERPRSPARRPQHASFYLAQVRQQGGLQGRGFAPPPNCPRSTALVDAGAWGRQRRCVAGTSFGGRRGP
jgi:hypothetical protein